MLTIGFTNVYYTLWSVQVVQRVHMGAKYEDTSYHYIQNLSMNFAEAQAKISKLDNGMYDVNLELRGEEGRDFTRTRKIKNAPDYMFSFGQLAGSDMRISSDAWQLERAMREEPNVRARVYARRRLIELGELVRRTWMDKVIVDVSSSMWDSENMENNTKRVRRNWMPKRLAKFQEEIGDKKGLFYTDKQRVVIEATLLRRKSWQQYDGFSGKEVTMYRLTFLTAEGYVVEYKGSNPPSITDDKQPVKIKATIKHNVYGDLKQTFLQRLKLV